MFWFESRITVSQTVAGFFYYIMYIFVVTFLIKNRIMYKQYKHNGNISNSPKG
jgi:hypothetical protein